MKSNQYYAIRQHGYIIPSTLRHLRRDAIAAVEECRYARWEDVRRERGMEVIKVEVKEVWASPNSGKEV